MKIPLIKQLIGKYSISQLEEAESAILEERVLEVDNAGDDAGDQLTNVMAAIWIKKEIEEKGSDLKMALRAYTQKVRDSIS